MTMVLAGEPNLRDVIAFPKNQAGLDPMSGAPTAITQEQLDELGLAVVVEEGELSARVVQRLLALGAVALLAARRGRRRRAACTGGRAGASGSRRAAAGTRRSPRHAHRRTPSARPAA